jgi:hypothetical protein
MKVILHKKMVKTILSILAIGVLPLSSIAQINYLDASTLPASLKEGSHAVKRYEKMVFEVKQPSRGSFKVNQIITVLDANGKDHLTFSQYSHKFRSIESAEIKVYDAKGNQLNKYKKREMTTVGATGDDIDDTKYTYFTVSTATYPVTIEIEYEINYSGLLHYERYNIQEPGVAVEFSEFIASVPKDIDLRYKTLNSNIKPEIKDDGREYKTYRWTASNLVAKQTEPGAGNPSHYFPAVLLAPNKINYDGYDGEVSSWKHLGLWYNNLVSDINEVPDNFRNEIKALVVDAKTDFEKASIVYNYLQKNFRYVSIQLGIGGWKPFAPEYVYRKKYGDCKGLSNFMKTCLDVLGIKSYNAWIYSDRYPPKIDPNFAYAAFNHQVLCVISGKDSAWVECTSKTLDFGDLGSSTENRYALLLTEKGGVLVHTPVSKASKNLVSTTSTIQLEEEASGKIKSIITALGEYKQQLRYVSQLKPDDQKSFFVSYLNYPTPDEHSLQFVGGKNEPLKSILEMSVEKIPEFTAGSKMFLNPRPYSIWQHKMETDDTRVQDFYFERPFDKRDTTVYKLPVDYTIEALPKSKDIKCDYATFKTDYIYDEQNQTVTSTARLVLNEMKIPASKYNTAAKFFKDVLAEYSDKIVIRRK